MNQPYLEITLAEDCGPDFLFDATFRLNSDAAPKNLTKLLPNGKPLRAMTIASILTVHQGAEFADNYGWITLRSNSLGCNLINTLAGFLPSGAKTKEFFDDYFEGVQFLRARRGNYQTLTDGSRGGKPPSVGFSTYALPLSNLRIFKKAKRSDEPRLVLPQELPSLALKLESFQVEQRRDWEPIVPEILKWTKDNRSFKASTAREGQVPCSSTSEKAIPFQVVLPPIMEKSQTKNGHVLRFILEIVVKKD